MSNISELREWANNKIKLYDKMAVEAPHLYASDVNRSMLRQVVELCDKTAWHYPSRGEYPKDGEWVLVIAKNASVVPTPGKWVMQYFAKSDNYLRSDNYFANKTYSIYGPSVACWQYIILPKENEK